MDDSRYLEEEFINNQDEETDLEDEKAIEMETEAAQTQLDTEEPPIVYENFIDYIFDFSNSNALFWGALSLICFVGSLFVGGSAMTDWLIPVLPLSALLFSYISFKISHRRRWLVLLVVYLPAFGGVFLR